MEQVRGIISSSSLSIGYSASGNNKGLALYDNLSFDLRQGELTCLLGNNGAGKSTLLRTLSAMQPALGGDVYIKNKKLTEYKEQELSQILGIVLTDKTSVGGLTVTELVSLGRYPYTGFWGRLNGGDKAIVQKAMEDVGIAHKAKSYVAELSDGERQKAMIAKAIAQECPIVLLDEPTAFLDVSSRIEIMNLLHNLAVNQNKAVLLSTHDIELTLMLADRLWMLSPTDGLICGITEDVILSDKMAGFFGQNNIIFEKETGRFRPLYKPSKSVFLAAEGVLAYWTHNFFARAGYRIVASEGEADLLVVVKSAANIKAIYKDETKEFSSFDGLYNYLKLM
ncbi:iron complex transport system ATP-binding protein [Dysgonomonas sp. PH5-45]|uniref:ABC transporter ATP-binding protein n=1 Tax=unclassified Dysgonomonas TaxID=2630389 RepID=UPI00247488F9|nr:MULTISPECIES: ABC transporter ATP-binding protein [unclassified Dysgonomonas]MDH6354456.1 iron complex transport system ATP-binding protein [Dysgonomonas sp. PH5-45]MDH6387355.1 iron complex transport system ATP-binding protein [Dysgonomonas sp. PH5-37]